LALAFVSGHEILVPKACWFFKLSASGRIPRFVR
jgi:hypothetical protein